MGGPPAIPNQATLDPALRQQKLTAENDRIASIQERVAGDTRDTLLRFGRLKALFGTGGSGGLGGLGNLDRVA